MLKLSPDALDFGTIAQGGKSEVTFWLHNQGMAAVEISRVETSCFCFDIELRQKVVEPGKKIAAAARVDLRLEPKFKGDLRLEATGLTKEKGKKAFRIYAIVNVTSTKVDGEG